LKKGGKRFEVACYKNKVLEWRNTVETDLDEVVQVHKVFTNVSKGAVASAEDLEKCFKTTDEAKIIVEILKKGELQIGEKERTQQMTSMQSEVAHIIADKTVNPDSKRPYTVTMIEKALAEVHFSLNPNKSSKQQALEAIKQLQESSIIKIARAQMRIRIHMPTKDGKRIKDKLRDMVATVEDEEVADEYDLTALIEPGALKTLQDLVQAESKGKGSLELLNLKDTEEGTDNL
jgi:ribosome maturation protein SDO1